MTEESRLRLTTFLTSKRVQGYIKKGKRVDGRAFDEYRPLDIEVDLIEHADGSARVKLGSTIVIAGINFGLDKPFPDTPEMGMLFTGGEILPTASLLSEPGPPGERAIELSRVVDRGIRESKMMPMEEMVLEPGEKVVKVYVDFSILADSGNLIDASSLACVAALATAKWPSLEELKENPEAKLEEITKVPVPIRDLPVAVTVVDAFGQLLVDPDSEEEQVMNSRLTITHTKDDIICAMQKGGTKGLTLEQIHESVETAKKKSKELRKILLDSVGDIELAS